MTLLQHLTSPFDHHVGDFGLSRESGTKHDEINDNNEIGLSHKYTNAQEITAGVGTQSYASPEQLNGKDYDSSSDVYSLGIILFEFCYPMKTGMERIKVFQGIKSRKQEFPKAWHSTIAKQFPTVHKLVVSMLSHQPNERPTASAVVNQIQTLLDEYTVLSLDRKYYQGGYTLLRIEAESEEGVYARTTKMIIESSPYVKIASWSIRGKDTKTIMEFALELEENPNPINSDHNEMHKVFDSLNNSPEIHVVRQINDEKAVIERNITHRTLSI